MSKPEILVADTSADPASTNILPPQEEVSPLTHPDNLAAPAQLTPEEHDRAKEQFAEIAGRVASAQTVLAERSTDGKIRTRFDWNAYKNIDKTTIDQVVADAHAHKAEAQAKDTATMVPSYGTPETKSPLTTFETIADIKRETDREGMRVPAIETLRAAQRAFASIEATQDDDGKRMYRYNGQLVSVPIVSFNLLERAVTDENWTLDDDERERYILASQATSEDDFIAEDKVDFENFKNRTGLEGDEALAEFKDHRISRVNLSDAITSHVAGENMAPADSTAVGKELVLYEGAVEPAAIPEKPNRRRVVAVLAAGALALGALFGIGHAVNEHNERTASEQPVEETVEKSQPATDGLGETSSLEELAAQQAEAEAQAQAEAAEAAAAAAAEAEANRHPLEAQEVRTVEIGGRGVWGAAEQFLAAHNLPVTNEYVNILMWDHLNWALEQARAQGQDVPATAAEFVNSGADRFMREYGATFPLDSVKKIEELSGVKAS